MLNQGKMTTDIQNNMTDIENKLMGSIGTLSGNIQTGNEKIQEDIKNINERLEQQNISFRQELERNNNVMRAEIDNGLTTMRTEIENELSSFRTDLGISREATENQIQQIRRDLNKDNTEQMVTLDARLLEFNTQLEVITQRVNMSEQQVRSSSREHELRVETLEARIDSLTDHRAQNGDSQNVITNVELNNENITGSDENESNRLANVPIAQCNLYKDSEVRVEMVPTGNPTQVPKFTYSDITMPKFHDKESDNPLRFLQELDHFLNLRGVPETYKVSVVRNSLIGKCQEWYDLTVTSDMTYADFKSHFEQHYWNAPRQAQLRWSIVHGRYDSRRDGSMVDFYIKISQRARHLSPPFSQSELFTHIANQFPSDVRMALLVTKPKDSKEMLEVLRELQPAQYSKYPLVDKPRQDNHNTHRDNNGPKGLWAQDRAQQHHNSSPNYNSNYSSEHKPPNHNSSYNNNERNNNGGNNVGSPPNQGTAPVDARGNKFQRGRGSWNNNRFQNRNPRVNYLHFQRYNRARIPHWWRRRPYNNNRGNNRWGNNNNYRQNNRFAPYNNDHQDDRFNNYNNHNNGNHNNNVDHNNQGRNACPPLNNEVGRLINARNEARNHADNHLPQGPNNEPALNN